MRKVIPFLFLTLALSGCGIAKMKADREAAIARLNGMVGQNVDVAIKDLGPPTSSAALTSGGSVLEWSRTKQQSGGGSSTTVYRSVLVGGQWVSVPQQQQLPVWSQTLTCRVLMTVSPSATIERWEWKGDC